MSFPLIQVDAFTDTPFAGNPAAVCILPQAFDEKWMQRAAAEMNLSETAFLYREEDGFQLRWFTPAVEVDLCGHATLASAHVLWEENYLPVQEAARFFTKSGELICTQEAGGWIGMDFPAVPEEGASPPDALVEALGITPRYCGKTKFDYLIEADSEATVRDLAPDMRLLETAPCRGVIVTARGDDPAVDFVSRFFAPAAGVDEDPVTGSAHCTLAPFWGARLKKEEMTARQISPRGGTIRVRPQGDRVRLFGQAVTVMKGELL